MSSIVLQPLGRAVGRAVVDDEELVAEVRGVERGPDAVELLVEVPRLVVDGEHDGDVDGARSGRRGGLHGALGRLLAAPLEPARDSGGPGVGSRRSWHARRPPPGSRSSAWWVSPTVAPWPWPRSCWPGLGRPRRDHRPGHRGGVGHRRSPRWSSAPGGTGRSPRGRGPTPACWPPCSWSPPSSSSPASRYAAKNRDPGVYINHAVAIADQGSTTLDDPVADTGAELMVRGRRGPHRHQRGRRGVAEAAVPGVPDRPRPASTRSCPTSSTSGRPRWRRRRTWAGGRGLFNLTPAFALGRAGPVLAGGAAGVRAGRGHRGRRAAGGERAAGVAGEVPDGRGDVAVPLRRRAAGGRRGLPHALARGRLAGRVFVGMGFVARPEGILVVGLAAVTVALVWAFRPVQEDPRRVGLGDPWTLRPSACCRPCCSAPTRRTAPDSRVRRAPGGPAHLRRRRSLGAVLAGRRRGRPAARSWPRCPRSGRGSRRSTRPRSARCGARLCWSGCSPSSWSFAWLRPQLLGQNFRIDKAGAPHPGLRRAEPASAGDLHHAAGPGRRRRRALARRARQLGRGPLGAGAARRARRPGPDLGAPHRPGPHVVDPPLRADGRAHPADPGRGARRAGLWERKGDRQVLLRVGTVVVVLVMGGYTLRQSSDLWRHGSSTGRCEVIDQLDDVVPDDGSWCGRAAAARPPNFAITPFTWLGPAGHRRAAEPDRRRAARPPGGPRTTGRSTSSADGTSRRRDAVACWSRSAHITGELSEFEHSFETRPRQARPTPST